jgi:hypothetical protein
VLGEEKTRRMQEGDQTWQKRREAVTSGRKVWREQHPKATVRESEAARDERLGRLRARMRPRCLRCGTPLVA